MTLLFILFFIPLVALSLLDVFGVNLKLKKRIYFLASVYVLFFTFSILEKSGDFVNYTESFDNINSLSDYVQGNSLLKGYAFEPGFFFSCFMIKNLITADSTLAIMLITLLAGAGLLYYIPKYTVYFFIALVVYIAHFYWWIGVVLLRQMCAMVILFPLFHFLHELKTGRIILLVSIASLFHASALVFFIFLFLHKIKFFWNLKIVIFVIAVTFFVGYCDVFKSIITVVTNYIPRGEVLMDYLTSDDNRSLNVLAYIEMLMVLGIALRFKNRLQLNNQYAAIAVELLICSTILAGLFFHYEIGSRLTLYFNLYSYLILIPTFMSVFKESIGNKILYTSFLCLYLGIFLVRFVYITI